MLAVVLCLALVVPLLFKLLAEPGVPCGASKRSMIGSVQVSAACWQHHVTPSAEHTGFWSWEFSLKFAGPWSTF